ncbi:hypothetical protein AAFF_G00275490 [Aldrovandia affinis]|uniref:Uncharacterized protein n=1 Tax=Aldrovandia affinis TaxID=143900 RepID=A0AAD7ST55_9TELE|nr:hypothetical protein AAFF_G00275490 [Aldrovandia affinis]
MSVRSSDLRPGEALWGCRSGEHRAQVKVAFGSGWSIGGSTVQRVLSDLLGAQESFRKLLHKNVSLDAHPKEISFRAYLDLPLNGVVTPPTCVPHSNAVIGTASFSSTCIELLSNNNDTDLLKVRGAGLASGCVARVCR